MDFLYIKNFHIITLIIVIIFLTSGCLLSTDSNFKGVSFEESDLDSNKYFSDTNKFEDDSDEDYIETTRDSAPSAYPPIASDDDLFPEIEMPNRSLILDNLRPTPTIIPKAVITKTPTPTPLPTKTPSPVLMPKATPTPSPTKAPVYDNTIVLENLMGKSESYVNEQFGKPVAIEKSEYGFYWHIYHKNYSGFIMIGIYNNTVVGLYSNSSTFRFENLKAGSAKSVARSSLCEDYTGPVTFIDKGNVRYRLTNTDQKDVFIYDKLPSLKNSSKYYVTVFYDNIKGGTITSVQIIDYLTEQSFGYMPEPDNEVVKSYEKISFYLVNSIRKRFNFPLLTYDNNMAMIAKAHSQDMIDRDYFSHTSLPIDPEDSEDEGKKYTDRIKEAGYLYLRCAENLSTGHPNAIYSHESLMNSAGHRENIFCNVTNIGIGVAITQGEVRMTQIYIKYQ